MSFKRRYNRKRSSKLRRIARGRISKFSTLAKQIQTIKQRLSKSMSYYNCGLTYSLPATGDYQYIRLNTINSSSSIFGTTISEDFAVNKTRLVSLGVDNYVTLANTPLNEEEEVQYTYFLVSLKDEIGTAFDPAIGALTLSSGTHYQKQGGMVMLNKKCFNIHTVKRFVLTNHGIDLGVNTAQTQHGTDKRFYRKISVGKDIINPTGSVATLETGLDPSKSYFALLFSNDSILDAEWGRWDINVVSTYKH